MSRCSSFIFFFFFVKHPHLPAAATISLPGPLDEVRQVIEQAEGVEGVADDLRDGPGRDEQQHAVLALHLQVVQTHTHTRKHTSRQTGCWSCCGIMPFCFRSPPQSLAVSGLLGQKNKTTQMREREHTLFPFVFISQLAAPKRKKRRQNVSVATQSDVIDYDRGSFVQPCSEAVQRYLHAFTPGRSINKAEGASASRVIVPPVSSAAR